MARSDVIVVGAGIVGTSTALQLARRGLAVALVDRRGPGEETSYGNAGVIGGAGVYPTAFPRDFWKIVQVALKRAPEANYHFADLPRIAPWLWAYFRESSPQRLDTLARELRPLMVRSVEEHDALAGEAGATNLIRHNGWLTLYRTRRALNALAPQFRLGEELGVRAEVHDLAGTLALEPSLSPVFHSAVLWPDIATVSNPLSLTRAYAALFARRGGVMLSGDARSLHRNGSGWRVDTAEG
ncbi:MAG: FAD-dependent oxidoreductase, partial [Rhizobiales bacterium]|nr:FAD-dependent oxidoreductase [Hyphomicrobiales bacterium]